MSTPAKEPIPFWFMQWANDQQGHANPPFPLESEECKAWDVGYDEGQIHGAIAAFYKLSQPSPGLRWVKACERLPEPETWVFLIISYPGVDSRMDSGRLHGDRFQTRTHDYNVERQGAFIEWLEEIPNCYPEGGGEGEQKPMLDLMKNWQLGKIPDFSSLPEKDQFDFVNGFLNVVGFEFLKVYMSLGLKNGIETFVINPATEETFFLSFYKKALPGMDQPAADLLAARNKNNDDGIEIARLQAEKKEYAVNEQKIGRNLLDAYRVISGLLPANSQWQEKYIHKCNDLTAMIDEALQKSKELDALAPEIKRQTIDRLYNEILAAGVEFPPAAREVFHRSMNELTASPTPTNKDNG